MQQIVSSQGGLLGMFNLFSGGALEQLSIFALGIMPYVTASIILSLLGVVIKPLEELKKEGEAGQRKINQYTRYGTAGLSFVQAFGISLYLESLNASSVYGDVVAEPGWSFRLLTIITLTTGTCFLMWLGEQITERGIGNGISLIIFAGIVANLPDALVQTFQMVSIGQMEPITLLLIVGIGVGVIAVICFFERAQRRLPIHYAKRMVGRKMYGGTSTYIPIKINMAGVIPVIFASSLLAIPGLLAQFGDQTAGWVQWLVVYLVPQSAPLNILMYIVLIIFFAYFYTAITFNPEEVADNMKKYGGFIPGIRAGRPTEEYLEYVLSRITAVGSVYLAFVAMIPLLTFILLEIGTNIPFGGTSIMIVVGVGMETVKQIESQLQQRHYEGFLR
jgi:preprotein translocase subunit SecY